MKRFFLLVCGFVIASSLSAVANPVIVKMNTESTTMTLSDLRSGKDVELAEPSNREYSLELDPGQYLLSGYANNGQTLNGTIVINVTDSVTTQQFTVITCTAYVSNKTEGESWLKGEDFELEVKVNTREGVSQTITTGQSHKAANRYTFLALNGNSYNVAFIPSEKHRDEGYMTLYRLGTLTANVNISGAIPIGGAYTITVPEDAELQLGMKFTHFTDFTPIEPVSVSRDAGGKTFSFTLAHGQVYNYRTWRKGGLTHAGYFTMNTEDASKCPVINFTEADYMKHDPKAINHSVKSNNGYETGDLLLNINPEHHLRLENVGDEFLVHGMRMWELTDNSTNNYFFEPDLHYSVFDTDFRPCSEVIEIENADTDVSAWSRIRAKGTGTAIVMVTYDGIDLNFYNNAEKKEYLGGEYWGAIWPENTGIFVVTVGGGESEVVPNMTVNEEYNMDALRLAGNNVDAEHDVFYYLDDEEGFRFTFNPEGVVSVYMASPVISETEAKYTGFSDECVSLNEDGSVTLLLREGRHIVRMLDAAGVPTYQVLRAKPCHREIMNETRPGSAVFQPGDKVKIQYSGLFHPANKIAGIYNMSAYVTYNGVPNGSSLILGSGQYTFGSAASAQAVTVEIPDTLDVSSMPVLVMNEGVIQVNGYGDPIGNHRNTSPLTGRSPNFTAVPHKTYFGTLPDIAIDLSPVRFFRITLSGVPTEAEAVLSFGGEPLDPDESGVYSGTYGTYSVVVKADGYKCYRADYTIGDDAPDEIDIAVDMQPLGNAWDGLTMIEPSRNDEGVYQISRAAELAWLAADVNASGGTHDAELLDDIELGNFDWTPIGTSSNQYTGSFNGNGHVVSEIFIESSSNHQGLFGYVNGGNIEGLTVSGSVSGAQYVGGLAALVAGASSVERCANYARVSGSKTYVGGLVGYLNSASASLSDCYNAGHVSGTTNCGGVIGSNNANAVMARIFNVGEVTGTGVGACVGGSTAKNKLEDAFSIYEYNVTAGQTLVSGERMASGEIAFLLGEAFFQTIGEDSYPSFKGLRVHYDEEADEYFNYAVGFRLSEDTAVLRVRDTHQLRLEATPSLARLPEIVWESSDEDVALVREGIVTAIAKGETVVTAGALIDGVPVVSNCVVSVIGALATELFLDYDEVVLDVNDNPHAVITASFGPDYADEPEVVWTSDDERVVVVSSADSLSATLEAVGDGQTSVSVRSLDNPDVCAVCNVVVSGETSVVDLIFSGDEPEVADVFDQSGRILKLGADAGFLRSLAPGVYIVRFGDKVKTILIRR